MASHIGTPLFVLIAISALSGCGGNSSDKSPDDDLMGPCVHYYYEPVVNIDRVISQPANTELTQVALTRVMHEDSEEDLEAWCEYRAEGMCYGLSFETDTPVCTLPCGFGTDEGDWHLEVSAEGYQKTEESFEAVYEVFEGGCPSYNGKGSHVELELNQQ